MLYILGLALALGVMPMVGCSETTGDGGSGGDAGSGGTAGDGGSGGMPECQSPEDCDDRNDCTENACADGMCEYTPLADGTACDESNECTTGMCASGECDTALVQDGTACGDDAGSCQGGSCQVACTEQGIRDAIAAGGGPFTFDCDGPTTIPIGERISVEKDLILDGQGNLTLAGGGLDGWIPGFTSLELRGLAISVDQSPSVRGVFRTLTVIDSRMTGGISGFFGVPPGGLGLSIRNTIIFGSIYTGLGPGIIEYSTIQGGDGPGIHNDPEKGGCGSPLTIRNTTISGNLGNGLHVCGNVTVRNSTISENAGEWALVSTCWGQLRIANSTVSGDVRAWGSGPCFDPDREIEFGGVLMQGSCSFEGVEPTSFGYNIESPGNTCGFDQATDQFDVTAAELNLGSLQDNGGPTQTHALGPGSFALNQIPAVDCGVTTDQRGQPRPEPGGSMCDVGAFEVQP